MYIIDDTISPIFEGVRYDDLEYITPEMFGAFGDGAHDDTKAFYDSIIRCTSLNKPLHCYHKYLITNCIYVENVKGLRITGGRFIFKGPPDCMIYIKTCGKLILDHITAECVPYVEELSSCSPIDSDKHLVTACNVSEVSIEDVNCKNMYTVKKI